MLGQGPQDPIQDLRTDPQVTGGGGAVVVWAKLLGHPSRGDWESKESGLMKPGGTEGDGSLRQRTSHSHLPQLAARARRSGVHL